MREILDLTHTISNDTPVYPGTEPLSLTVHNTIAKDGYQETMLHMNSHTGTHMDAPGHILEHAATLDKMDISRFFGRALVVDCTGLKADEQITMKYIEPLREAADKAEFLLFYTGWSRFWMQECYYASFPYCGEDVIRYCVETGKRGVGIDTPSIDPMGSTDFPMHCIVFGAGLLVIENLANLDRLLGKTFTFASLPLKYENADGSPVRAVALID